MKRIPLLFCSITLLFAGCAKERPFETPQAVEEIAGEASSENSGELSVLLSEELALEVEKGGSLPTSLNITSMERVFPDAGEFEERSRAEGLHRWYRITYDDPAPATKAAADMIVIPGVEICEPPQQIKSTAYFNDPYLSTMWHYNDGKDPTASINVEPVWRSFTTGSSSVIVGVIDGGIQTDHPDLEGRVIPGGVDGSKNFCNNSFNITAHGHGTHVGGTIGAINNNGKGVCGIAGGNAAKGIEGVRLLSCQIFSSDGTKGNTALAIKWAADHGATIINNSWGYDYDKNKDGTLTGDELTRAMEGRIDNEDKAAIDYFIKYAGYDADGNQTGPMAGGVVIFAAGNDGISNGAPANYEPVIAVGATDQSGRRSSFSNYGPWVDIAAPGVDILSTYTGGQYAKADGTSMACPHVTGVAALLLSYYGGKGFTNEQLKDKLLNGANPNGVPAGAQIGPLLDAMGSFTYSSPDAPAAVTEISSSASGNCIRLDFDVTANSEGLPAYSYMAVVSKDRAKLESFDPFAAVEEGVRTVSARTNGLKAGENMHMEIPDLDFAQNYYVCVFAANYQRNYSASSSIIAQSTFANNPPVVTAQQEGPYRIKASETRKLEFSIDDPDGHSVSFSFDGGSDAADYSFDSSRSVLTITILGKRAAAGTYTASITATDKYGASATFGFDYTILENEPPVVVKGLDDILKYGKDETIRIDLSGCFRDPEEEGLSYKVRGVNTSLLKVSFSGRTMILTPVAYGYSELTVVATDPANKECTTPLKVLIKDKGNPAECFPNPVTDILTVRTEQEAPTRILITNSNGVTVFDKTLTISGFSPAKIDMTGCAPGQYSLSVSYGDNTFKKRIIKK